MHNSIWLCTPRFAQLRLGPLSAVVEPSRPDNGLTGVALSGIAWRATRLLSVGRVMPVSHPEGPVEWYTRGTDLIAAYQRWEDPSARVDAVWRAVAPRPSDRFLAAVDLIVSVRTESLDSPSEMVAESLLAVPEAFGLAIGEPCGPVWLEMRPGNRALPGPARPVGCFLCRLPGSDSSYVEMIHPSDFVGDQLAEVPGEEEGFSLRHSIFRRSLEKGVILRARLRSVFVPRSDDMRIAADCYASFAATEPPLGA
jgi:hypothetical protein